MTTTKQIPKLDASTLQVLVAQYAGILRNLVVPNVSNAFFAWESDILVITPSGYATEYEIKISVADLKREWRKERWRNERLRRVFTNRIRRYVIVVPHTIAEKCLPHIPDDLGAGLLSFEPVTDHDGNYWGHKAHEWVKPRINGRASRWTETERIHLGQGAAIRYWQERKKTTGLPYFEYSH